MLHHKNGIFTIIINVLGDFMKIKFLCRKEKIDNIVEAFKTGNYQLVEYDYDFLIVEEDYKRDSVIGRIKDSYSVLKPEEILYIESYGHEILCTTKNGEYYLREKLYEIEGMFYDRGFIRINKSYVINKNHIKDIKPTFNSKFIIKMKNNTQLEVTRSYYHKFKESIGF